MIAQYLFSYFVPAFLPLLDPSQGPGMKLFIPSNYSVVDNIFVQSTKGFNGTGYDLHGDSFGLIDKSEDRWTRFRDYVEALNAAAGEDTTYKVIYIARHGQGYHNLAETKYGTPEWNCHYSHLNGTGIAGEEPWGPDPQLTSLGIAQALAVNAAWKQEIRDGVPLPEVLYSSPLRRSAKTLELTWRNILIEPKGMRPIFKEMARETIGLHTCDKRNTKSIIEKEFPSFVFETPFTEDDILWGPDYQETHAQQTLRIQQLLNQIFATDPRTYISITAHSGTINAFFAAVDHRHFTVQPGGFVPVIVKATKAKSSHSRLVIGGQSATLAVCSTTVWGPSETSNPIP